MKYNNMTDFVKHAKVKRQILDLEKKIKREKNSNATEENEDMIGSDEASSSFNNLISNVPFLNKKSLKYKVYLNIIIYVNLKLIL